MRDELVKYIENNLFIKQHNGAGHVYEKIKFERAEEIYLDYINNFLTVNGFANHYRMIEGDANEFIDNVRILRIFINQSK